MESDETLHCLHWEKVLVSYFHAFLHCIDLIIEVFVKLTYCVNCYYHVSSLVISKIPPWSKSFRTRHRVALSFDRFQFFFFCCVGKSVIDVLSDFQLDCLTFLEVTLYCVRLSLCVVSIFHKKKISLTLQQRVCIKFCVKNGLNGAQT